MDTRFRGARSLIVCFSGTGNTWTLSRAIAKGLSDNGVQTDVLAMEQASEPLDITGYSIIGIGFPVFVGSIPANVYRWVRKLPSGQGRKTFIFSTKGGGTFGSEALLAFLLAKRGYRVVAGKSFFAPCNDGMLIGTEDMNDPAVARKFTDLDPLGESWAKGILEGSATLEKNTASWKLFAALFGLLFRYSIQFHIDFLTDFYLKADKRCSGCGLCERICPTGNIQGSLEKPRFGTRCVLCERCLNYCPVKSIHFLLSPLRPQYRAPGFKPPVLRKAT